MSTEPRPHAAQILRVALLAPLVYGTAVALGADLPFVSGVLFATAAVKLPAPPPFRSVLLLALLLALLPFAFGGVADLLNQHAYLMLGVAWLALFFAFRLQTVPRTAIVGTLLQGFALLLPVMTGLTTQAAEMVTGSLALNGVLAVAGVYLGFALFPAPRGAAAALPPAPVGEDARRTQAAAVAALVMMPPFALFLTFDIGSAVRTLFTMAVVLAALSQRGARETGLEILLSVVLAGLTAIAFSALNLIWQQPAAALLAMALLGLLVVPFAFEGRHRGAVALAVPLVWVLFGTAADSTTVRAAQYAVYSAAGVLYVLWARALVMRLVAGSPVPA